MARLLAAPLRALNRVAAGARFSLAESVLLEGATPCTARCSTEHACATTVHSHPLHLAACAAPGSALLLVPRRACTTFKRTKPHVNIGTIGECGPPSAAVLPARAGGVKPRTLRAAARGVPSAAAARPVAPH